ncbi:MAG: hypothetical protein ABGY72_07055 [bacterium]
MNTVHGFVSELVAYRPHLFRNGLLVVAVVLLITASVDATPPSQPSAHRLIARVTAVSRPPDPATAPYRDALAVTKFTVEEVLDGQGQVPGDRLLAALTVMRDLELVPAPGMSSGTVYNSHCCRSPRLTQ